MIGYIRYFAATDADPTSSLGRLALQWLPMIQSLDVPVRLVSQRVSLLQVDATGRTNHSWDKQRDLLLTEMEGPCVASIVCVEQQFWKRLFTPKYKNILIVPDDLDLDARDIETALRYERIICPDYATANCFESESRKCWAAKPTINHLDELRDVLGL
jgi:hypothetical protein